MRTRRTPLLPWPQLTGLPRRVLLRSLQLSRHAETPPWYPIVTASPGSQIHRAPSARLCLRNQLLLGYWPEGPPDLRPALIAMGPDSMLRADGWAILAAGSTTLVGTGARLRLGDGVVANVGARIVCMHDVTIGAGTALSWDVTIMDTDQHPIVIDGAVASIQAPVVIGEKVWVGTRATILKGVTIGDSAIIAAGALVTSDVAPHTLVGGVPAKVLRSDVDWWP